MKEGQTTTTALWVLVACLILFCGYLLYRVEQLGKQQSPAYVSSPGSAPSADAAATPQPWTVDRSDEGAVALEQRLNTLVLPSMEFRNADIRDVIKFLVTRSVELDPEGQGVNIVLNVDEPDVFKTLPRLTLSLRNVPMLHAIKYITEIIEFEFRVDAHAIVISDKK